MGVTDASADEEGGPDPRVSSKGLTKLAGDLGEMQDHLAKQVKRMDAIVDRIETGWRGPAPRRTGRPPRTPYASVE
jgi:hypothetical protein